MLMLVLVLVPSCRLITSWHTIDTWVVEIKVWIRRRLAAKPLKICTSSLGKGWSLDGVLFSWLLLISCFSCSSLF